MRKDVTIDLVAGVTPALQGGWERAFRGQAEATIEGDPAHNPGMEKLMLPPAHLPNSVVFRVPMITDPIQQPCQIYPQVVRDGFAIFVIEIDGVHQLAINIELKLVSGTVADAHGCRLLVALQVGEELVGQATAALDAVE